MSDPDETPSTPIYDGEYEVIPKPRERQTLPTQGCLMMDDVIIKSIPYSRTSNESGITVSIG